MQFDLEVDDHIFWMSIFLTLSMDKTDQFWAAMGLTIRPTPALKDIAQIYVREVQDGVGSLLELMRNTFKRIDTDLGEITTHTLYEWANMSFEKHPDESRKAVIWRALLGNLAGVYAAKLPRVDPELPDDIFMIVKSIVVEHLANYHGLRLRILTISKEPTSVWEEYIYQTFTKGCNPMDWLINQVTFISGKSMLLKVVAAFNREEIKLLFRWGQQHADILGEGDIALAEFGINN